MTKPKQLLFMCVFSKYLIPSVNASRLVDTIKGFEAFLVMFKVKEKSHLFFLKLG